MSRRPEECVSKAAEYRRRARSERGKARDMLIDLARYWESLAQKKATSSTVSVVKSQEKQVVEIAEPY